MALTDSTDDDRAARVERALERAAEVLQRVDAALQEPRPDPAEADRRWREYEAGRRARDDERAWEQSLERSRAPSPQPAPAAPGQYLSVAAADARQDAMIEAIARVTKKEREESQGRLAALEIRLTALEQGAPKPAAHYLTLESFETIMGEYIQQAVPNERTLWRERVAELEIKIAAPEQGLINATK
ncbi:hypothetical protein [Methylocystis parvus]|uniref:hypothetical protein n=1 Tax=Methylocystis parvus TaxID=134 RepID=UPI003C79184E